MSKRYTVCEVNEKGEYLPCCNKFFPLLHGWPNATFDTLTEAIQYARLWLGVHAINLPDNWMGNEIDYSGYGDKIVVIMEE